MIGTVFDIPENEGPPDVDGASDADVPDTTGRQRAAATKRRRTVERIVNGVSAAVRTNGMNAKIEDIVEEAGVSAPTFYNFYKSRNDACRDAVTKLIVVPLFTVPLPTRDALVMRLYERVMAHPGSRALIRCGLLGRLEASLTWDSASSYKSIVSIIDCGALKVLHSPDSDFVDLIAHGLINPRVSTLPAERDEQLKLIARAEAISLFLFDSGLWRGEGRAIATEWAKSLQVS